MKIVISQSEENYLKAIFSLQVTNSGLISTNLLAESLQTKASSVTDMLKKLDLKGFINYEKYRGFSLTEKGEKYALEIIRKHRLWEVFLVNHLNFGWDEVHEIAEQLEHIKSVQLIDRMEAFLNYPKFDPHGDPIPSKEGKINYPENSLYLHQLEEQTDSVVIAVEDGTPSFLQYLDKNEIRLGSEIRMMEKYSFDHSALARINNSNINISAEAMRKIRVKLV